MFVACDDDDDKNDSGKFYPDPVLDWGATSSSIKSQEKNGILYAENESYGYYVMEYHNYGKSDFMQYIFYNDELFSVSVVVNKSYDSNLFSLLAESYYEWDWSTSSLYTQTIESSGADIVYIGLDATDPANAETIVEVDVYSSSQYLVGYAQFVNDEFKSLVVSPKIIELD